MNDSKNGKQTVQFQDIDSFKTRYFPKGIESEKVAKLSPREFAKDVARRVSVDEKPRRLWRKK